MRIRPRLTLLLAALLCATALGVVAGAQAPPAAATDGPTITGDVSDEFYHPLGGIVVAAVDPVTEAVLASDITLPGNGSFSFIVPPALMTAGFKVRFADPAKIFTTEYFPNATTFEMGSLFPAGTFGTQRLNFVQLATELRGTLSGTAQNTAGQPLWGMTVHINTGSVQDEITTTSAADGSYSFTGLNVGSGNSYCVSFSDPSQSPGYLTLDYDADSSSANGQQAVKVSPGQTTTVTGVMRRSCTLTGVVTDSRTHLPVPGIQMGPVLAPGQPQDTQLYFTSGGLTDATGTYTVTGIPDGIYIVRCGGQPPVYRAQYWPTATTPETATQIALTPTLTSAVANVALQHDATRPTTAALNNITMRTRNTARFKFRVSDSYGENASLTIVVATAAGKVKARAKLGVRPINVIDGAKWDPVGFSPGKYTWWVTATDLAGNTQSKVVKKSLVLTR